MLCGRCGLFRFEICVRDLRSMKTTASLYPETNKIEALNIFKTTGQTSATNHHQYLKFRTRCVMGSDWMLCGRCKQSKCMLPNECCLPTVNAANTWNAAGVCCRVYAARWMLPAYRECCKRLEAAAVSAARWTLPAYRECWKRLEFATVDAASCMLPGECCLLTVHAANDWLQGGCCKQLSRQRQDWNALRGWCWMDAAWVLRFIQIWKMRLRLKVK